MYVSGSVPVYVCTLSRIQPHTHALTCAHTHIHSHQLAADGMLISLLGGAGDAGILAAINVHQAYPCVHPLHSVDSVSSKTRLCSDGAAGAEAELEALALNTPPSPSPESSSSARSSN